MSGRASRLVDLTYQFDESTHAWPGNKPFSRERTAWGETSGGYWYASGEFSMSEHAGTHMDAPIHFARDQASVDKIPLDRLLGPAVVVDARKQAAENRDYRLTREDLRQWEAAYGRVPAGSLLFMLTGWGASWTDRERYFGSSAPTDPATLHFPAFSREAVEFLVVERAIRGIGIDTASVDYGPSRDFPVHQLLNGAGLYALENVAQLDQVPPTGATIIALPLKIRGGSGGPVRIIALLP
jgi:kynurenine formamidase